MAVILFGAPFLFFFFFFFSFFENRFEGVYVVAEPKLLSRRLIRSLQHNRGHCHGISLLRGGIMAREWAVRDPIL